MESKPAPTVQIKPVINSARQARLAAKVKDLTRSSANRAPAYRPAIVSREPRAGYLADPIRRAAIQVPETPLQGDVCLATVVSPGFESFLDSFLGSVEAWGNAESFLRVVFVVDDLAGTCRQVAEAYGWQVIECESLININAGIKAVLYSITRLIDANHYVCLDADTLVFHDLQDLVAESIKHVGKVLITNNDNALAPPSLGEQFVGLYKAKLFELACFCGSKADFERIRDYPHVVNDGVMCGGRKVFERIDNTIRDMPSAIGWIDEAFFDVPFRNQFSLNSALARLDAGVLMHNAWNVQMHCSEVERWEETSKGPIAFWKGEPVRILHLTGDRGKSLYKDERNRYQRVNL